MNTLVIFSHTNFKNSRVNRALLEALSNSEHITIRNLESLYGQNPEAIDVKVEQKFIENNNRLVFMCPVFWFSTPPMLKAYIDRVFEHGWAYGSKGHALEGKIMQLVLSTGSPEDAYKSPTIGELFLPLTTVGVYTGMKVAPIRVTYGCLNISDADLKKVCNNLKKLLEENA
ncbi:MAG: NAD(P)H-dependent oxidoreductase [Succinivibrio sp.]|nr:NAD(P)H-dependent oxidoreductase [Succinivibrio sp.]